MAEATHKPGQWRALCLSKYTLVMRDRQPGHDETGSVQICHIAGPGDNDLRPFNGDRWEADAHLIAAAPELLEALQLALPILEAANAKCTGETTFIQCVRAAIAKATGG